MKILWLNCKSSFLIMHKVDNNPNISIRGFTMWKQNISVTKCNPQWVLNPWTSDSKSNILCSVLTWHVLLRRSLNLCSCTTWCLDLDDLGRINRAWLYKGPKVLVLQANAKLVQSVGLGIRGPGVQYPLGVAFCYWNFLFLINKASDANMGIIANFVY